MAFSRTARLNTVGRAPPPVSTRNPRPPPTLGATRSTANLRPGSGVPKGPPKPVPVPARSKINVNKTKAQINLTRGAKTKEDAERAQVTADERLEEVFAGTLEIAIALMPTVPYSKFQSVRKWIAQILDRSVPVKIRHTYLTFLVLQIQNFNIMEPFDKPPPKPLQDPSRMFTGNKLKTMMREIEDKNTQELLKDNLGPHSLNFFRTDYKVPQEFYDDQPMPNNGLIAYGSCFSNFF